MWKSSWHFSTALLILSKPMRYWPRGPRQQCIRKDPAQFCINTLETKLYRSKLYEILCERLQTTLREKNLVQYCLNTPGAKLNWKNRMQCCLRGAKQHCTGKNLGKVCLNNVWSLRLHKYIRFFMSKEKNQVILPLLWKLAN